MSMFSRSNKLMNDDPFEEMFALNLGDFLTEHLISDELAVKIKHHVEDEPQKLKNQLRELSAIYSIDNTLNILGFNNHEDFVIYNSIAKTIAQMIEADACHIFLVKDRIRGTLENDLVLVGSSIQVDEPHSHGYSLSDNDYIVQSYKMKKTLFVDVEKNSQYFKPMEVLNESKTKAYTAIPMCNNVECLGVIVIENYSNKNVLPEFLDLVNVTAHLFATSLQLQTLTEEVSVIIKNEKAPLSILKHLRAELTVTIGDLGDGQQVFVERLADVVDLKAAYTDSHSSKVASLARKICEYLELNEKTKDLVYYAAMLQHIGKIILPTDLFNKKGKLSDEEWKVLESSPNVGVNLLMRINFLSEVIPYIHYHRERWDGKGKPEGLKGYSIPLGSRIIAVADTYCALTSKRPYRDAFSDLNAIEVIKEETHMKWDPIVVDALCHIERSEI